jgi:3-oxoacyl-[acyl-carrier-protein] synthase II
MTAPNLDGPRRAMLGALRNAGLNADAIDYLNAHGTSTPRGDTNESNAIKAALGDHATRTVVSSTKSMTAHLLGAAGAVEAIFCILALRDQICPPTLNLDNPSVETKIDLVPHKAKKKEIRAALSNSFGFGGTNATLILTAGAH